MLKDNDCLRTPQYILDALGEFNLDPCAGVNTRLAKNNYAIERGEDGLQMEWVDTVWCNPPFSEKELWIEKMISHGNGILLLPERGSAPWFGPLANSCGNYFVSGEKINFLGGPSSNNLGSCFFPFGERAVSKIINSGLSGHFVIVERFTSRLSATSDKRTGAVEHTNTNKRSI